MLTEAVQIMLAAQQFAAQQQAAAASGAPHPMQPSGGAADGAAMQAFMSTVRGRSALRAESGVTRALADTADAAASRPADVAH